MGSGEGTGRIRHMTQPPTSSAPAHRGWLIPLVIALVLVVLAAVAVVGWTFLRPISSGDYDKLRAETQMLIDDYQTEVMFQVSQTANGDGSDLDVTRGNADLLQRTLDDYLVRVEALQSERAFGDEELALAYKSVVEDVKSAGSYLEAWADSVPLVKHMQYVCAKFDAETGYLSSHATADDFDAAAADCAEAVKQAADVEAQSSIVEARKQYLEQRRTAWELNGQARAGGTIDRTKSQEAMRLDAESTRTFLAAEETAVAEVADELNQQLTIVPDSLTQFQAAVPAN